MNHRQPEFLCEYGNCQETETPIVVSNKRSQERVRFCCEKHAALYLLRGCSLATLDEVVEECRP